MYKLKSQAGFTLVELVVGIVLSGLVVGISSQIFSAQMDTYNFISTRKTSMADLRYTMNRMTEELKNLNTESIEAVDDNGITFSDEGNSVQYELRASGESLAIYRGDEKIIDGVQALDYTYYNELGETLAATANSIPDIRQIEVTITLEQKASEGEMTLTSRITPRDFIYSN